jgi:hypothetical protein
MPEHFRLLISEPSSGTVALVLQVLKQRVSRQRGKTKSGTESAAEVEPSPAFWQRRY